MRASNPGTDSTAARRGGGGLSAAAGMPGFGEPRASIDSKRKIAPATIEMGVMAWSIPEQVSAIDSRASSASSPRYANLTTSIINAEIGRDMVVGVGFGLRVTMTRYAIGPIHSRTSAKGPKDPPSSSSSSPRQPDVARQRAVIAKVPAPSKPPSVFFISFSIRGRSVTHAMLPHKVPSPVGCFST